MSFEIINISNVKFNKIKNIQIDGLNWSGALKFINAEVSINNAEIFDNFGEDAVNIVGSNSYINNLIVHNAYSDSIDIDFGELKFGKIVCKTSGNDCLDTLGPLCLGIIYLVKI